MPVAQKQVLPALNLPGRLVSLDALPTQDETARTVFLEGGGDHLLTVKTTSPPGRPTWNRKSRPPEPISPSGTTARPQLEPKRRTNKGRDESRAIRTAAAHTEDVGFPFTAQVASLRRQSTGRKDEEVALITSTPQRLGPALWLKLNRQGWGIENGLHQRLDVSLNDDCCRVSRNVPIE